MNIHLVYAHPSATSLNAALRDEMTETLAALGHTTTVSDLYAMKWKAVADYDDFGPTENENFVHASGEAFESGALAADIRAEQEKLLAADAVILQFPVWWFSMPAIMKGWVDRVMVNGFGYGTTRTWRKYGEGTLARKRAMVVATIGASETSLSDRGVHGSIDDMLFPIQHGILFYTGMDVLPPFTVSGAVRLGEDDYAEVAERLRGRLEAFEETEPIAFRKQRSGDYDEGLRLKPGLGRPGTRGFDLHTA